MRPLAWVFNLDAEFELAKRGYSAPDRLRAQLAEHGRAAHALMGPEDVLAEVGMPDPRRYVGRAWCPTARAIARLRAAGVEPEPHPAEDVLRLVNHRHFAHALGGSLPNQRWVTTREGLDVVLREQGPWLLKRPLAFAGRGQLRITGACDDKQQAWIAASLRADGLIVEPLVTPLREFSLHGFIWRDGRHALGRACVQEVDLRGTYRGVRLAQADELGEDEARALHARAESVATALFAAGYFGPFGVDAYRYAGSSGTGFCALSEINARYTMAFAIGFAQPAHTLSLSEG